MNKKFSFIEFVFFFVVICLNTSSCALTQSETRLQTKKDESKLGSIIDSSADRTEKSKRKSVEKPNFSELDTSEDKIPTQKQEIVTEHCRWIRFHPRESTFLCKKKQSLFLFELSNQKWTEIPNTYRANFASWNPTGESIVYSDYDEQVKRYGIAKSLTDGSNKKVLLGVEDIDAGNNRSPCFIDDGKFIVWSSKNQMWKMNANGAHKQVIHQTSSTIQPTCIGSSSNGRFLYYLAESEQDDEMVGIWKMDLIKKTVTSFANGIGVYDAVMSKDGKSIYVLAGQGVEQYSIDSQKKTGQLNDLHAPKDANMYNISFDVSADGKCVAWSIFYEDYYETEGEDATYCECTMGQR